MSYSVYMHKNKINSKVYIGVTSQLPERRWQNGEGYIGTFFYDAIKNFGWDTFEHTILFAGLNEAEAYEKERELIAIFDSTNPDKGYNSAHGGKDNSEFLIPKYGAENPISTAVHQIDPITKTILARWESQNMAAKALDINRKGITKCCRGECRTYKGYIWEYADKDYIKPYKYERGKYPHEKQKKAVLLTMPNGNAYSFDSIKAAAEYVGERPSNISRYISGLRTDKTGRGWSYVFHSKAE